MKNNHFKNIKIGSMCLLIFLIILFLSIGFSAYQNDLFIRDLSASVLIDKDMRILNVKVDSTKDAISHYEDYNASLVTSFLSLPTKDSYIIYDVDVYNLGNVLMGIQSITLNEDNLQYEILNYNLKDKICEEEKCISGAKKTLQIKVSYKDGVFNDATTDFDVRFTFNFKEIYEISYRNISGSETFPTEIMDGEDLEIHFTKKSTDLLKVFMSNRFLTYDEDYSYKEDTFVLKNVTGPVHVTLQELSIMKKKVICTYVSSCDGDDLPLLDFGAMTTEERKNVFGNIATAPTLNRTNGLTGQSDALVYRGNVTNNYVRFAGYDWRILQIDEEGNLRIILDDSVKAWTAYQTTSTITNVLEASNVLGFQNSLAKQKLEDWTRYYEPFKDKVVTSLFCNDFNYITKVSSGSKNTVNYFQSYQYVGPDAGLYYPSLLCENSAIIKNDIGLISAEEYVLAGGAFTKENQNFFLYNANIGTSSWTLSPSFHDEGRNNGMVFIFDEKGTLLDYQAALLRGNFALRPVITITGNEEMLGDGTKENPYRYKDVTTASKVDITNLNDLEGKTWFIGSTVSGKGSYGVLSETVSTKLNKSTGLLGLNTVYFNEKNTAFTNISGVPLTFENLKVTDDNYFYQIKTKDNKYLRINDDLSVTLEEEPCYLKISLVTEEDYTGHILITNESDTVYLNFYGSESGEGDDKFAGWAELDKNDYIQLFELDYE